MNTTLCCLPDLADQLAQAMADTWHAGPRHTAAELFQEHPELATDPDSVARLLFEEVCLREEAGDADAVETVAASHPRWADRLRALFGGLAAPPALPEVGETLGEFRLIAELGRGATGRVFLAEQPELASRPVVLKVAPDDGGEHLSLARLQHAHIVPLFGAVLFPARRLRGLWMPDLGGLSLADALVALRPIPLKRRRGQHLLDVLDRARASAPGRTPAREFLARANCEQAVCWIGACLADALAFAHERKLLHLDIKPANVLLAADGSPRLLDFHLARAPIETGAPAPEWLGGTEWYMPPEQWAALDGVAQHRPMIAAVDARADLYALAATLLELLAGGPTPGGPSVAALREANPTVSVAFGDLLARCLMTDAERRYPSAAALAMDLRRHLADRSLIGVRNRSWPERWGKWCRRQPLAPALVVAAGLTLAGAGAWTARNAAAPRQAAAADLAEALRLEAAGQPNLAVCRRGLARLGSTRASDELQMGLIAAKDRAHHAEVAGRVHALADQARLLAGGPLPITGRERLREQCQTLWAAAHPCELEKAGESFRDDLRELAWLVARLLRDANEPAEPWLIAARQRLGPALDPPQEPRTGCEFRARGVARWNNGATAEALADFERALELKPGDFWANFHTGIARLQHGQPAGALACFHACVALAPDRPECYTNRALAYEALGDHDRAAADFSQALAAAHPPAEAALGRGLLRLNAGQAEAALADFRRAEELGADPVAVRYNMALAYRLQDAWEPMRRCLDEALARNADHAAAKELRETLPK